MFNLTITLCKSIGICFLLNLSLAQSSTVKVGSIYLGNTNEWYSYGNKSSIFSQIQHFKKSFKYELAF